MSWYESIWNEGVIEQSHNASSKGVKRLFITNFSVLMQIFSERQHQLTMERKDDIKRYTSLEDKRVGVNVN